MLRVIDRIAVAALRPTSFSQPCRLSLLRSLTPSLATTRQTRPSTTSTSAPESSSAPPPPGADILVKQRLSRPVSPNIGIYKAQITWYLSGLNRITGSVLSGGLYIFGFAYLISPLFGWHIESPALVAAFAGLPAVVKVGIKLGVALPFTFHCFNGVRHLWWDTGRGFANQAVIRSGWFVVGLTAVTSVILAAM